MEIDRCPKCKQEIIDEWDLFEHEYECGVSCFNCEHSKVAMNQEPCASCRNRCNWKLEGVEG